MRETAARGAGWNGVGTANSRRNAPRFSVGRPLVAIDGAGLASGSCRPPRDVSHTQDTHDVVTDDAISLAHVGIRHATPAMWEVRKTVTG
jgi:hypothetical protein